MLKVGLYLVIFGPGPKPTINIIELNLGLQTTPGVVALASALVGIDVIVQYNSGFLPAITMLTRCLLPLGNPTTSHE